MLTKVLNSKLTISMALFILALIPRLLDLGRFLTADEFLWVDRSRNFLAGLTNPAYQCDSVVEKWNFVAEGLACTLRTGHPGVTTMWTGTFGFILRWLWDGRPVPLHEYVVAVSTNPLDASFIAWERLGTVLLTSLWVVAVYWLVRRLFGARVALIGALFMALNPFHIALSRVIHHDALSTTFMTLSVLCIFVYWGQRAGRRWLLLSGVLAGLGFLSKSPSLYLMPFVALTGLWFFVRRWPQGEFKNNGQRKFLTNFLCLILDGLLWFAVAATILVIFWPAIWVAPIETLETVFLIGSKYATGGHAKGNFFWGEISKDPGPLFYLVSWLYRVSPLVILGLLGGIGTWLSRSKSGKRVSSKEFPARQEKKKELGPGSPSRPFNRYLPLILLFILGYFLIVAVSEKKQERYFLPVYPWLDLIAAAGLLWFLSFVASRFNLHVPHSREDAQRNIVLIAVIAILIVNGLLTAANYPYYFTYYNPLFGGAEGAEKVLTIGWGEGLDLAADYLNQKTETEQTRIASWYQSTFAPYYEGEAISYSKEKGKVLAGDYAIFYINQTQRRFPDDILFEYFEERFELEKVISLHGIDYVWIYPSLGVDHYIQDQTYTGIASLLAWQWTQGDGPLSPGQPAEFELYWEYLGKQLDETFFFRLVDSQGRTWAEGQSQVVQTENPAVEAWREGEIIVERGALTPPLDMPPGQYQLQIGFYTEAPAVKEGELLFEVPADEALITIGHNDKPLAYRLPDAADRINQPLTDALTLLGATWPNEPVIGRQSSVTGQTTAMQTPSPIPAPQFPHEASNLSTFQSANILLLDLYWRVEQPLPADTHLHIGLMDANGEPQQAWFNLSLAETFNDSQTTWQAGDILHTRWQLDLLPETPPGEYHLEVVWPDDPTQTVAFGTMMVIRR